MSTSPHALIIGAGLAGPMLALALARKSIGSTIFEIRQEASTSGGSISLAPNASLALDKAAGIYEKVLAASFPYDRLGAYSEDGYKYGEIQQGNVNERKKEGKEGYPCLRIRRTELHQVLLNASREQGDLIKIVWGASITEIKEGKNGVTAIFSDGTSATGDFLVGADGIHSKVREYVAGGIEYAPKPAFTGTCIVNQFLPAELVVTPHNFDLPAFILSPAGMIGIWLVGPEGKTVSWGISQMTEDQGSRKAWAEYETSGEAKRRALDKLADCTTQPLRSLVINSDKSETKLWVPYEIEEVKSWYRGRVCLIGDAAHTLPPNGQGCALGWEDAAFLSRLIPSSALSSTSDYSTIFSHFERIRKKRIGTVKLSGKNTTQKVKLTDSKVNPWIFWAKTWVIWAFFKWKGGVVRDERTLYDYRTEDLI